MITVNYLLSDIIDLQGSKIKYQIKQNPATLTNEEKLFFLNMIKQYKQIKTAAASTEAAAVLNYLSLFQDV